MQRTEITIIKLSVALMVAIGLSWIYIAAHTFHAAPIIPCELPQVQKDFPTQCIDFIK